MPRFIRRQTSSIAGYLHFLSIIRLLLNLVHFEAVEFTAEGRVDFHYGGVVVEEPAVVGRGEDGH